MSKVKSYKVWIHIEGLDRHGDIVEGDEYFEPHEVGEFEHREAAESFRSRLEDLAAVIHNRRKWL